jgi:GTP cyclohydrolase II
MAAAQSMINDAGCGVIIYLDQEGKGNGHLALIQSIPYKLSGSSQAEAYEMAGYPDDARSYRAAAAIISDLGIQSVTLLSENSSKAVELRELGANVTRTRPLNIKSKK